MLPGPAIASLCAAVPAGSAAELISAGRRPNSRCQRRAHRFKREVSHIVKSIKQSNDPEGTKAALDLGLAKRR